MKKNLLYDEFVLFTGTKVDYYPNGTLHQEIQYVQGIKEGSQKIYTLNGKIKSSSTFRHGKKDGLEVGWFAEGPKRIEFHFKNGVLDGTQTEWHLNGSIFRQVVYDNGVEKSKKIFYDQGEIYTNYVKRDNRIYGQDGGPLCMEKKREGEK